MTGRHNKPIDKSQKNTKTKSQKGLKSSSGLVPQAYVMTVLNQFLLVLSKGKSEQSHSLTWTLPHPGLDPDCLWGDWQIRVLSLQMLINSLTTERQSTKFRRKGHFMKSSIFR